MKNLNEFHANKIKTMLVDGDLLAYKITSALEEAIEWEDDVWTLHCNLDHCKQFWKQSIAYYMRHTNSAMAIICFSDVSNFRKELDLEKNGFCVITGVLDTDEIEFCKERSLGGISPKKDDIKKALTYHENIFPIIRPRKGNFIYNNEELGEMVDLIEYCKKIGCKGVVFGVLNSQNEIDKETCKILMKMDFVKKELI